MSTRCYIGIENKDKTIDYIYCHHDGYIDGVGKVLLENYQDESKIRKLIKLGGIDSLGYEPINRPKDIEDKDTAWMHRALLDGSWDKYWDWHIKEYKKYCSAYGEEDPYPAEKAINRKLYESEAQFDIEYIYLYTKTGWKVFMSGGFRSYTIKKD